MEPKRPKIKVKREDLMQAVYALRVATMDGVPMEYTARQKSEMAAALQTIIKAVQKSDAR